MTRQRLTTRRRPVPFDWREEHHWLSVRSTRSYGVRKGSGHYSRSQGICSCGERWPTGHANNLHYADVVDLYMDHVERAYYNRNNSEEETTA